jgi:hypothetical protein
MQMTHHRAIFGVRWQSDEGAPTQLSEDRRTGRAYELSVNPDPPAQSGVVVADSRAAALHIVHWPTHAFPISLQVPDDIVLKN